MSAIVGRKTDPRVARTRAAVKEAATALFLQQGYTRTTMEEIAAAAGITKRTIYNNFADKEALFTFIVRDVTAFAGEFAGSVPTRFEGLSGGAELYGALHELARGLAQAVLRPEVLALRRLLVAEAREFPDLAQEYFERAPGLVLGRLASAFEELGRAGLLRVTDGRLAAEQFAYLVVAAPLDRALLTGAVPDEEDLLAYATAGVETFVARYVRSQGEATSGT